LKNFKSIIYISLGSNLQDRKENIRRAVRRLSGHPGIEVVKCSGFYESEPLYFADQPRFLNCVVEIKTGLGLKILFKFCKEVEKSLGRKKSVRYGPRVIDLDILAYGDRVIKTAQIQIPHPRLEERRFVLEPLSELDPGWEHPVSRKNVLELLAALKNEQEVNYLKPFNDADNQRR